MRHRVVVLLIAVLGVAHSAPIALAQSAKEVRDHNYAKLFSVSNGFFAELPNVCKSDACALIAADGNKIVSDGADKYGRGALVDTERIAFHKNLEAALQRGITELQRLPKSTATSAELRPHAKCLTVDGATETTACSACYDTYEVLAEICALYAFVSPSAALICLGAATVGFGRCVLDYCTPIPQ